MASSSTAPVGPPLQPGSGKELEVPPSAPAASTEAMVDVPVAPSPVPGEPVPVRGFLFSRGGLGLDGRQGWNLSVDQAWVPNLDEISELLIQKGDLQAVPINFDFLCACSKDWSHWVDREILDPDFWDRLVDAGVHCSHPLWRTWLTTWMLPILGEHSFSDIKLSAEEEEVAAALRKRASTRLSGWPAHFSQVDEAAVRRAAFDIVFPLHHYSWATFTRNWTCSMIARFKGDSCYILSAVFNTSVLQTFFWEHSVSYTPIARDKSAAWGRFSDLPREFLEQFPDFRANLPLVYRWVGLKTHDHDLVDALDYEENVLFRPYGEDYPADDYRSLSYLSTVNPGFLPVLSATGVYFIPYCPQRVQRQFGLDQGVPVGPQETGTCIADLAAFLKSRAFVRLGRSATTPMSVHRKASVSNPYLAPPSQSAISYANSQKLGFAEWDASRGGWIAYTIHLPEGWRNSVTIVEDRLIMVSKRGQVNKRDAPVDPVFEKTPKKATPSVPSSKKVSSKKAKTVKKSKPPLRVPSAAKESTAAHVQESAKSATAPPKRKTRAGKESKSIPLVPSAAEESLTAPLEEPAESTESPPKKVKAGKKSKSTAPETSAVKGSTESTVAPSKPKSVGASSQPISKKSAASRSPKGQKKADVSSSSPDEEEPSAVPGPSPPKKKKFTAPLFPLGAAGRTRSKSGPKVTHESGRSGGGVVDIEDSDVADDDIIASPVRKDAPQAAAVDQDEGLGKSTAGSSEAGDESMGEEHSSSSASFFDSTPGSLPEDQVVSAGSTADDDTMSEADDSSMGGAGSMEEELAIIPHGGHDDDSAVDADADPISFSLPQTVSMFPWLMSWKGFLFLVLLPSLRAIPAGGFVIPASRLSSEDSPVAGGALVPERSPAQSLIESGSVVDLGVDTVSHDAPIEDAGTSAVDASAGSDHLENIDLGIVLWKIRFCGLGCRPMEKFCSMDLVVVLWKILFRGLGCRPMEISFPMDLVVAIDHGGFLVSWTWLSSYERFSVSMDLVVVLRKNFCSHGLDCVDDTVHVLEDVGEVGTTGEVTAVSPPPRPTNEAGPSVDVGSLSSEVAAFLREFDARAPNPHPEQFFWSFNGPLVPFGDFWVPNDCSPYLSRLSAGHSDFTKGFKLSIGLGGPMMSLLGSVLAAMDESSLEDVTKTQILAWRSVIQDLMDVGFDLGFMMERLRQMAQHLFGKRLADEIKALQHQIALLQDSLAELTAYQAAMTSTEGVVPRSERGGSFLDSLLD
uniref:Aminotransferase-like plant mobile domain-containing protein n=1 Tax=Fagus sylvatica TaxID=28930 RepID=A0A2N9H6L9_FAGSY